MRIDQNRTVLAIMFFAVIVSGCTGGGNQEETSSTASVQVNEFSAFPNPTPSGQKTRFRMQLVNQGDAEARNTSVRLYNPPFADNGTTDTKTWRDGSTGNVSIEDRTLFFDTLSAPSDQTPAVPKTRTRTYTAPELDQGRTISYDWNAYMMFEYQTDANTEIQIMGGEQYREQGSPSGSASLENSRGPIKMEVRTPTPIVFYDVNRNNNPERQLCVIIRNQGNGIPFAEEPSSNNIYMNRSDTGYTYNLSAVQEQENKVNVRIEDIGNVDFEPFDSSNDQKTVDILSGKGVQCWDMKVDVSGSSIQTTVPLSLEAVYNYRKSTKTTATVEGRRQ